MVSRIASQFPGTTHVCWLNGPEIAVRFQVLSAGSTLASVEQMKKDIPSSANLYGQEVDTLTVGKQSALCIRHESGSQLVFQRDWHEFSVFSPVRELKAEGLEQFVKLFEPSDSREGLRVHPKSGSRLSNQVSIIADEAGSIAVRHAAQARSGLPKHQGKKVKGGELWVKDQQIEQRSIRTAIIANESAVAILESGNPSDERFALLVSEFVAEIVP